ncbi:MAG: hypothetical protein IKJ94_00615 [Oscillospiraceae bacterium]|nr:hypothetical protein [Oscillospiraceae bacterium]
MKKSISLLLVTCLLLTLCACGTGGAGETTEATLQGLHVGYARESIMPDGRVNMSGSGNQAHRISDGFYDMLYATCLAMSEGGNTVLLYSTDTLASRWGWTKEARKLISEATGVPQEQIQIGGTHTHAGPAVGGAEPLVLQWKPIYMNALVAAGQKALADLAPTTMYGKKVVTENLTFVRHYVMKDGSYAGSNFGDSSKGFESHAAEADPEMVLVKMDREGDKKDILLMNFQAHPCFTTSADYTTLSADYIGATRTILEKETGMNFIYFLGAAGNLTTGSSITTEKQYKNKKAYSEALAQYALDVIDQINTPIDGTGVKSAQKTIEYKCNDYGQDRLEEARLVTEKFQQTGDASACTAYARTLGFHSVYECNGIVNCSKYPPTDEMTFNVARIGGLGFVAADYEMFAENGVYIKENSPFEFTIVSTCTNGYNNYFPTEKAFSYGCYESFTARFASGVAEMAQEEFVGMLKGLQ